MAPVLIVAVGLLTAGGWYELRKKGKKAPPSPPAVSAAASPSPKTSAPKASAAPPKTSAPAAPPAKAGDPSKDIADPFAAGTKYSDKPIEAPGGRIDATVPPEDPASAPAEDDKSISDKAVDAIKDLASGLGLGIGN